MLDNAHSSATLVINLLAPQWATANPRLGNIHASRIVYLDPAAILGLDFSWFLKGLAVDFAQSHSPLRDGQISCLLQIILDLCGHLLLGPSHLGNCIVDILSCNLTGQHDQFLHAGRHEVTLVQQLPLRHLEPLLLGDGAVIANHLYDFPALPAYPAPRIGIRHHGHVLARLLLGLLLGRRGGFFGGSGRGWGFCRVDFVLEDVVGHGPVHVALEKGGSFLGVVELRGGGVLGSRRGRSALFGARFAPALEDVDGPFGATLRGGLGGEQCGCKGCY